MRFFDVVVPRSHKLVISELPFLASTVQHSVSSILEPRLYLPPLIFVLMNISPRKSKSSCVPLCRPISSILVFNWYTIPPHAHCGLVWIQRNSPRTSPHICSSHQLGNILESFETVYQFSDIFFQILFVHFLRHAVHSDHFPVFCFQCASSKLSSLIRLISVFSLEYLANWYLIITVSSCSTAYT